MKTSLLLLICLLTTSLPAQTWVTNRLLVTNGLMFTNDAMFTNQSSPHPIRQRVVKHTNVTEVIVFESEPCVTYHYYGMTFDGGMKEMGKFADHDPLLTGWEGGNFDPSIRFILRSESPASKLCVIRQMEHPNPLARFPPGLPAPFVPIPPLPFPIQQTNHITKN